MMRKIIAFLQVSVDGFIEGPNKEVDWMMVDDEEEWRETKLNAQFCRRLNPWGRYVSRIRTILACPPDQPAEGTTNHAAYAQRAEGNPISSFPRPLTMPHGRRQGSLGM